MKYLINLLTEKPLIGGFVTLGGIIPSLIDTVIPICQLIAILIGIGVGILTMILTFKKIVEINKRNKNGNNHSTSN